jgi:hypothetical protein
VSANQTITINPNAAITSVTGTSAICIGATTTYTANGVVLGGTGTGAWSSNNTAVATVNATTGVVTGAGTTFTSAMVGGLLKVVGQSSAYLITAFSSTTSITVKDQGDNTVYTGGAFANVAAGQDAFVIWGATHIAATKSTIYKNLVDTSTALNARLAPRDNRWIVVNAAVEGIIRQAPEFIPAVQSAYGNVVENGRIGSIAGFKVYTSELIDGNNTTGYWLLAGSKDFISFACQIMKVSVVPSEADPNSFITTCKGLLVWGRKVFAVNRALGATLRVTVS